MAYIITEPCVDVKDQSCVNVCPMDCIYHDDNDRMLYINPNECVDCGACEAECPVAAIFHEDDVPTKWRGYTNLNALYFTNRAAARAEVNRLKTEG